MALLMLPRSAQSATASPSGQTLDLLVPCVPSATPKKGTVDRIYCPFSPADCTQRNRSTVLWLHIGSLRWLPPPRPCASPRNCMGGVSTPWGCVKGQGVRLGHRDAVRATLDTLHTDQNAIPQRWASVPPLAPFRAGGRCGQARCACRGAGRKSLLGERSEGNALALGEYPQIDTSVKLHRVLYSLKKSISNKAPCKGKFPFLRNGNLLHHS